MGGQFTHYVTFIIFAAVALGVMVQLAKNPSGANTLFAAGVDTLNGITHGLEGR